MAADLGFGVVGLGMGKNHCRSVARAKGAKLVAVCDVDEERLGSTAEEYGCKAYTSYEEMLQDDEVQVSTFALSPKARRVG